VSRRLRPIAGPFVVAAPAGARVRTRLFVSGADSMVLGAAGEHLGSLAGRDLARRCAQGRLDAAGQAASRRARKQVLTAEATSRWAGAITRTSEDAWALAERNLVAETRSLRARCGRIRRRVAAPVGRSRGRVRGYGSAAERWEKQRRLQVLQARLEAVEGRLAEGRLPACRGGRRLAKARHNLDATRMTEQQWRRRWQAKRWFITADGEADKAWGNETVRWHPDEGWLEIKLPAPLAHLANRPHGRYRLCCPVSFPYRGDEVAAQAASGPVRYDIIFDPDQGRWYLDASWKTPDAGPSSLGELQNHRVLAVDVNGDHLAAWVLNPDGNPIGVPRTLPLELSGLPAATRDGHLRAGISELVHIAEDNRCAAVVVENLDFTDARQQGRERHGRRPSRGRAGRSFRRLVASMPTAKFRDRLVQMAANAGLAVIAVDPAYTSKWGAQHWLGALKAQFSPDVSGHHAAAVMIGRRGLGQRARRRVRCDSTRPEDRQERATNSAGRPAPATAGLAGQRTRKPGDHEARGQPHPRRKTRPAERASPDDQATQDRSGPPVTVSTGSR
jgi:IS605 OrfB family transposase